VDLDQRGAVDGNLQCVDLLRQPFKHAHHLEHTFDALVNRNGLKIMTKRWQGSK